MLKSSKAPKLAALIQAFELEQIPLTGVLGFNGLLRTAKSLDTAYHLQDCVEQGAIQEEPLLNALQKQHKFFLTSGALDEEDSGRIALSGWRLIQDRYRNHNVTPLLAAHAIEDGAMHTHSLAVRHNPAWWLDPETVGSAEEVAAMCVRRLDTFAEQLLISRPRLFRAEEGVTEAAGRGSDDLKHIHGPDSSGSLAPRVDELQVASREQMAGAAEVIGRVLKIHQAPFEWMYEGYKPLLLPDVVVTKKGMSVSLATLLLCVLRRVGLTATPYFQDNEAVDLSVLGSNFGSFAVAPEPTRVLLCGGSPNDPCVMDPALPVGKWMLDSHSIPSDVDLHFGAQEIFRMWAEHAATMVLACQRRGESDEVVRWMYQHAALHPAGCKLPGWT